MTDQPQTLSNARKLTEFHRAIGQLPPTVPTAPDLALLDLRQTLLQEEWQEVRAELEALRTRITAHEPVTATDLAPLAHEIADLLYVAYGTLDQLGIDADAVFAEVHRANLSKTTGPKRADGKQLKPEGWQPADVRGVLQRMMMDDGSAALMDDGKREK